MKIGLRVNKGDKEYVSADEAILEMNQVPNFKADYNATIKEIEDTLESMREQYIEENF